MYSCFVGLPVALLILIFKPSVINLNLGTALLIVINAIIHLTYLFPYFKSLHKADASIVIPLFQLIPVFSYFLAFAILGETLSNMQIIASIMIICGAIGISIKFEGRKTRLRGDVVMLMLLASLLVSINFVMFKFFAIDSDFWTVSFWQYIGFLIFGLIIFLLVKSYRRDFLSSFRKSGKKVISLNVLNESISVVAGLVFTYATLLAPVALVSVINGFQPLFVFLIGLLLTIFVPHIIKEDLGKKIILQKVVFILLMFIGAYLLQSS